MKENEQPFREGFRTAIYFILAIIAIFLAGMRVFSEEDMRKKIDPETLWFLAAAAVFVLFERIKKLNIGKDGVEAEFAEKVKQEFKEVREVVAENNRAITGGIGGKTTMKKKSLTKQEPPAFFLPEAGKLDPIDPQKGRFGGKPFSNDRRISATVEPARSFPGNFNIALKVESTNKNMPLEGEVIFFLHNTFRRDVRSIKVKDGSAKLDLLAYGAFTVGAAVDDGKTLLELDLSEDESFPYEFRMN